MFRRPIGSCSMELIVAVLQILAIMTSSVLEGSSAAVMKSDADQPLTIVSRAEWKAREPKQIEDMVNPVPYVIIHHSYIPGPCNTTDKCEAAMRSMQNFHMDDRDWFDVGYSFAVGGDGKAYEGRGWSRVGAHAPKYNFKSIGICTIGDWRTEIPPPHQLKTVKALIALGVENGHISKNYKLIGHRQTRPTECPGQAYFDEIKTWPHYSANPREVHRKNEVDS